MAVHLDPAAVAEKARIVPAPTVPGRNRGERVFDLHPAVHLMVIGAWLAFVIVLGAAFMGPDLLVPAGIILVSVVGLFLVPGLWARVVPDDGLRRPSWNEFRNEGVDCLTGRLAFRDAMAQIMTLPALLLGMAFFFAALKSTL